MEYKMKLNLQFVFLISDCFQFNTPGEIDFKTKLSKGT